MRGRPGPGEGSTYSPEVEVEPHEEEEPFWHGAGERWWWWERGVPNSELSWRVGSPVWGSMMARPLGGGRMGPRAPYIGEWVGVVPSGVGNHWGEGCTA